MTFALATEVTTVGRGDGVDLSLRDPTVSRLHAELVRRGPHLYVSDLGLSSNGTRVNGRPVGRRLLADGDVVTFGTARCRVSCLSAADDSPTVSRRTDWPELTRRETEVLVALCRPRCRMPRSSHLRPRAKSPTNSRLPKPPSSSICCTSTPSSGSAKASAGGLGWPTKSSARGVVRVPPELTDGGTQRRAG